MSSAALLGLFLVGLQSVSAPAWALPLNFDLRNIDSRVISGQSATQGIVAVVTALVLWRRRKAFGTKLMGSMANRRLISPKPS